MPFAKGETPEQLKGKGIPQKYIDQFVDVFNAAYEKDKDESAAFAQAHAAMGRSLRKDGYRQGKDKKWHKITKKESQEMSFVPLTSPRRVVIEEKSLDKALEEGLRFTGVALVDHAVSQQGSPFERYYSPAFNDQCLQRTKEYIEQGHVVTIYNTHGAALGGFFDIGPDQNPIGKLEDIWRDGEDILYRGFIAATDEGKDVIRLMHEGIRTETSVRIYDVDAKEQQLESEDKSSVIVMEDGYIGGIDFCDEAGIPGAGVVQILESAPRFHQEDSMLTIEELKQEHPDLYNAIVAEGLGALSDLVSALKEENEGLKAQLAAVEDHTREIDALKAQIAESDEREATMRETLAQVQHDLELERLTQGPLQREIIKALREENPENPAERIVELRDQAMTRLQAEYLPAPKDNAKGQVGFEDEDEPKPTEVPDDLFEGMGLDDIVTEIVTLSGKRN